MSLSQPQTKPHLRLLKTKGDEEYLAKEVELFQRGEKNNHEFTEREIDILNKMSEGMTAEMIAEMLHISPHTVKTHQRNMLKKTKCSNGVQLVAQSIRMGFI
ncbi:MAG: hypothetical protein CMP48_13225 [Rickettsiales bacterium]|nr:hypothetical protein [Rickettsiales bacterium]